jgi:hypothetical protein
MNLIGQAIGLAFGGVIVFALLRFIYRRHAIDWEQLVSVYGRDWREPAARKRFGDMLLYSEGRPLKSYNSLLEIGLHDDGIALRPNRFLVPFHRPIFVPYTDIQGWDQSWYLNAKSAELSFQKAPHMRLIMPRKQADWMLAFGGDAARISDERPPHGTRPWRTQLSALLLGAASLFVLIIVIRRTPFPIPGLN